jgi:hypothetical protein
MRESGEVIVMLLMCVLFWVFDKMDIPAIIEVFPTSPVNQLCVVIVHIPSTSLPFP